MQNTMKVFLVLAIVVSVVLLIGVIWVYNKAQDDLAKKDVELKDKQDEVDVLNGQLKTKKEELRVKEETETQLKTQLDTAAKDKEAMQQQLAQVTNDLFKATAKLQESAQAVATLGSEKKALQGTVDTLNAKVVSLDDRIAKLMEELDRGEKNRQLLLKELASVQLEKANLEKRFNNYDEVRGQYGKLSHDRRLEMRRRWIAQGYDGFYVKTGRYEVRPPYVSRAAEYDLTAEIRTNKVEHRVSDKPGPRP